MNCIRQALSVYGAIRSDCVVLEQEQDHRLLRYIDLMRGESTTALIDAVVESQSQPLLYIISSSRLVKGEECAHEQVSELRRRLAMRGKPAWLGILWPGKLDIYSIDLQPEAITTGATFESDESSSVSVIPRLACGEDLVEPAQLQLRDVLLGLMTDAGIELKQLGLSTNESIALTGRALFFRFLIGRGIISQKYLSQITRHADSLEECFGNERALAETNAWMDRTFNGNLLCLPTDNYNHYFHELYRQYGSAVGRPLRAILGLDKPLGPGVSQGRLPLGWSDLCFDHIPVGLLSETYEDLMRRLDAVGRRETSVYYTPSHIAEYMVAEALHLNPQGSYARVLDPACGAGVFLIAAYRRLAELRFEETRLRPNREELRKILNTQLTGFDINNHARMLASLALYLTALELDPHPAPIEKLAFDKLEDKVLIDVSDPEARADSLQVMIGSIGNHVPKSFCHSFDLVIGNPPWTALNKANKNLNKTFTARSREVAQKRGLLEIAECYENPDNVPDLPFLWCAMEWAKENGRICFVVAGRFLFKRSGNGLFARQALFRALRVTGIVNGAALRKTSVWPNMTQPFCLLFAENQIPKPEDQFLFISPEEDSELNRKGRIRIDASDAEVVSTYQVLEQPTLFKTLFRGTYKDVELIERLSCRFSQRLGEYWVSEKKLQSGQGFQVGSRKSDDVFLKGFPVINASYQRHPFCIDPEELQIYIPQGLLHPRHIGIYKGPLVLLREATRSDRNRGRALFSPDDIAYSESFYGFSAAGRKDGVFVTHYLLVLLHSSLFEYYQLMTSSKFGIEREAIQVADVKAFPFIAPENLSEAQKREFEKTAQSLIKNQPDWEAVDKVVFQAYCVSKSDVQMVRDILATRSPFSFSVDAAQSAPALHAKDLFYKTLCEYLNSVFKRANTTVKLWPLNGSIKLPWHFFVVANSQTDPLALTSIPDEWLDFADGYSVSRIVIADKARRSVVIGLLDKYRYWTVTQAKMLASEIIWRHGALIEGGES